MPPRQPWDPLPFPVQGDAAADATYAAVGLMMSQWEAVEFDLARLYSFLAGTSETTGAFRDYGGNRRIFRERLAGLEAVATRYFVRRCSQAMEARFADLTRRAAGFSERRNEIAHGIVMEVSKITYFAERLTLAPAGDPQHLLVPPYHVLRQHDGFGLPAFAYNSGQIRQLASRLLTLSDDICAFRQMLASAR